MCCIGPHCVHCIAIKIKDLQPNTDYRMKVWRGKRTGILGGCMNVRFIGYESLGHQPLQDLPNGQPGQVGYVGYIQVRSPIRHYALNVYEGNPRGRSVLFPLTGLPVTGGLANFAEVRVTFTEVVKCQSPNFSGECSSL